MVAGDRRDENVDIEEQADAVADFVDGAAYVGWLFRGHLIDSSDLR